MSQAIEPFWLRAGRLARGVGMPPDIDDTPETGAPAAGKWTAIARLAKVGAPIVQRALDLLERIGGPILAAADIAADQVRAWQWANRCRIAAKAARKMEADGVAAKVVPPDFLLPLLSLAGDIADEGLQELWANLLASGVTREDARHPALARVLAQMSAAEARVLVHVAENGPYHVRVQRDGSTFGTDGIGRSIAVDGLDVDQHVADVLLRHLLSLGLLDEDVRLDPAGLGPVETSESILDCPVCDEINLAVSPFGRAFLAAVMPGSGKPSPRA